MILQGCVSAVIPVYGKTDSLYLASIYQVVDLTLNTRLFLSRGVLAHHDFD